jgi:hypothetical protein
MPSTPSGCSRHRDRQDCVLAVRVPVFAYCFAYRELVILKECRLELAGDDDEVRKREVMVAFQDTVVQLLLERRLLRQV